MSKITTVKPGQDEIQIGKDHTIKIIGLRRGRVLVKIDTHERVRVAKMEPPADNQR